MTDAPPDLGAALAALQRAGRLFRAGRYMDAADIYREVIRRRPRLPDVHNNLGIALKMAGHVRDAAPCFKRAVKLKPDYIAAHVNLAATLEALGKPRDGLEHRVDAWRLAPEDMDLRDDLVHALRRCPFDKPHAGARAALTALHARRDVDRQNLAGPTLRAWRAHPAIGKVLDAARHGFPGRPAGAGFKPLSQFLPDELVIGALCWSVIVDPAMEAAMTRTRRLLLDRAAQGEALDASAPWLAALAVQARLTEWVWFENADETADLALLERRGDEPDPGSERTLVRALYRPLETDPQAEALRREASMLAYDADDPWALLLRRSLLEPRAEMRLAETIPRLTPIGDATSAAVRDQYEEHPYPRWRTLDRRPPRTLAQRLERALPALREPDIPDGPPRILVAGCGTGRHAIQTALRYADARVLAVDLSTASLAYAKRMAADLNVPNLSFAHADILALGDHAERFDLIECSGVLHHLARPLDGWRVLRRLLAPGGFMRLALYSRRARAAFDEVRAGIPLGAPILERIRAARRIVHTLPEKHPARALLRTADFYTASGVRDALLHAQETAVDPLWINDALGSLSLRFLGFELPEASMIVPYRQQRPNDPAGLDLYAWEVVEIEHPALFLGMYQFWTRDAG
ncbi:MAG: methyltransferase domain-containing protein [Alphaproteobacteria bacterium]|nr:methyltransferase domain-containing protein [Alphaproteobacteria bacterium]